MSTLEYCCECGEPTGHAGRGEDSLYTENDQGPFCSSCFDAAVDQERRDNGQFGVGA